MWVKSEVVPVAFKVPSGWTVDHSMETVGVVSAVSPKGLSTTFRPNVVAVSEEANSPSAGSNRSFREFQEEKEAPLHEVFEGYRLLLLDDMHQIDLEGVVRIALYYSKGLPLTMHQFIVRQKLVQVSVSFTYPTMEAPLWQPRVDESMRTAIWGGH